MVIIQRVCTYCPNRHYSTLRGLMATDMGQDSTPHPPNILFVGQSITTHKSHTSHEQALERAVVRLGDREACTGVGARFVCLKWGEVTS